MANTMSSDPSQIVDHLFRREAGRMVAVLTRLFGVQHLELAEDVVQEAFVRALQTWKFGRLPDDPAAWLMQVAKNRALDLLRTESNRLRLRQAQPDSNGSGVAAWPAELFYESEIADSQLRLIFACCHPALKPEDQLALTLKTAAGFGVREIARALLLREEAVRQRLHRARRFLTAGRIALEIPSGAELTRRLDPVLMVLYLIFNEGYNSVKADELIRRDLCLEAMRLAKLLAAHPAGQGSSAAPLLALMCYHAARFDGRLDADRRIVLLPRQDRTRWDRELIAVGHYYMRQASTTGPPCVYRLEAAIAGIHCLAPTFEATDWPRLLTLYDQLYLRKASPLVLLNKVVVLLQLEQYTEADRLLSELEQGGLAGQHYLFHAVAADYCRRKGDRTQAVSHLRRSLQLAVNDAERELLRGQLIALGGR